MGMIYDFSPYTVPLCDLSTWNDDESTPQHVDFTVMRSRGIVGVFVKVGQGTKIDLDFIMHWHNAKVAGMYRGPYWFLDWSSPMVDQADLFCSAIAADPGELPLVADYEMQYNVPADAVIKLRQFCDRVLYRTGKRVILYTSLGYWGEHGSTDSYWAQYILWIAQYHNVTIPPTLPEPWKSKPAPKYIFWQFSSNGDGPYYGGDSERMDMNVFYGTMGQFLEMFNLNPNPPQPYLVAEVVTTGGLNLRAGAGTGNIALASLNRGSHVKLTGDPIDIIVNNVLSERWYRTVVGGFAAQYYHGQTYMHIE